MHKISKSDITPEDEAREREAARRFGDKKCQHFTQGSFILYRGERCEILENVTTPTGAVVSAIRYPDSTYELVLIHALNQ